MPVTTKVIEILKKHLHLIMTEMAVLQTVHRPHIVLLFQALTATKYSCLIREYVPGGNLYQLVKAGYRRKRSGRYSGSECQPSGPAMTTI